jgi:hypothetical protein
MSMDVGAWIVELFWDNFLRNNRLLIVLPRKGHIHISLLVKGYIVRIPYYYSLLKTCGGTDDQ